MQLSRRRAAPEEETSLAGDARALHSALSDLVRLYQFRDRDLICCHDVSVTQCYALEALVTGGRQRLTALAARLSLDKSTASRVVDALERKGYVTRIEDAGDGRAVALSATSAGRRLHHRIQDELVREQQKVLGDLTPAARRGAIEIIRRLTRAAQRRFSAGSRSAEGSHSSPAP